jgi:ubiquinone/menaquinone biosynthesis C-methylase UbiE
MDGRNAALIERLYPGYRSPKLVYQQVLNEQVRPDTIWLDIGCGRRICADDALNAQLPRRARLAVGCDRDSHLSRHSSIKHLVLCDASALPFRSGVFNLVTTSMVVEHLEHPQLVFDEVHRVSRPGGCFVVFTPNRFNYAMLVAAATPYRFHLLWKKFTYYLARHEWRDFEDDVFPTWYRANSLTTLRRLLARAGFRPERLQYLSLAHSFGFVRPLYALSLLCERLVDRFGLDVLKADILGVFVRGEVAASPDWAEAETVQRAAAGGR